MGKMNIFLSGLTIRKCFNKGFDHDKPNARIESA